MYLFGNINRVHRKSRREAKSVPLPTLTMGTFLYWRLFLCGQSGQNMILDHQVFHHWFRWKSQFQAPSTTFGIADAQIGHFLVRLQIGSKAATQSITPFTCVVGEVPEPGSSRVQLEPQHVQCHDFAPSRPWCPGHEPDL